MGTPPWLPQLWKRRSGWLRWFARLVGEDTVFSEYLCFSRPFSDVFPKTFSPVQLTTAAGKLLPEGGEKTSLIFQE